MKNITITIALVFAIVFTSCKNNKETKLEETTEEAISLEKEIVIEDKTLSPSETFAKNIETAHNKEGFMNKKAISFDMLLNFNGKQRLDVKVTMLTNSSKIKFEYKDGSSLIYDGSNVYLTPASTKNPSARFDIFTWPYFMAMPFKLTDDGTQWNGFEQKINNDEELTRAKLSFKNGVGDTSEDWYMVYADQESNLLSYAAYVVTYGKTLEKAEAAPHAIAYTNYTVVDGVAIADLWDFYNWSDEKELFGDSIGDATLTNITFLEEADFTVTDDSKIVEAPTQN